MILAQPSVFRRSCSMLGHPSPPNGNVREDFTVGLPNASAGMPFAFFCVLNILFGHRHGSFPPSRKVRVVCCASRDVAALRGTVRKATVEFFRTLTSCFNVLAVEVWSSFPPLLQAWPARCRSLFRVPLRAGLSRRGRPAKPLQVASRFRRSGLGFTGENRHAPA
jgi:hypothetical protein